MSEGILKRNCESCDAHISVLDLCQEPDLILCELCKPWVLDSIYKVDKNPLTWLDTMLNAVEHMNFFEGRATEYSKASTQGSWTEAFS